MNLFRFPAIRFMRLGFRVERAEVMVCAEVLELGEIPLRPSDPRYPPEQRASAFGIRRILAGGCEAEVRNPVVGLDAVDVVDLLSGPFTSRKQPRDAVFLETLVPHCEASIAPPRHLPRDIAGIDPLRRNRDEPREEAGFRAVGKSLLENFHVFAGHQTAPCGWGLAMGRLDR